MSHFWFQQTIVSLLHEKLRTVHYHRDNQIIWIDEHYILHILILAHYFSLKPNKSFLPMNNLLDATELVAELQWNISPQPPHNTQFSFYTLDWSEFVCK